jgi:hypothetical protein
MMRILTVTPMENHTLAVTFEGQKTRTCSIARYLHQEAFAALVDPAAFAKVRNGGYFVEWANGADLSADTLWHDSRETPAITA